MLPTEETYGQWPASGEIDIMESRGNDKNYPGGGVDTVGSTLHWGPFFGEDKYDMTHGEMKLSDGTDFSEQFHVFGLEWTEDYMKTYVDTPDNVILNVSFASEAENLWTRGGFDKMDGLNNPWEGGQKNAPFDSEFYLVLNVAVGGTNPYFPDGEGGKCWTMGSQTAALDFWNCKDQWYPTWESAGERVAMRVGWVRVYQ